MTKNDSKMDLDTSDCYVVKGKDLLAIFKNLQSKMNLHSEPELLSNDVYVYLASYIKSEVKINEKK